MIEQFLGIILMAALPFIVWAGIVLIWNILVVPSQLKREDRVIHDLPGIYGAGTDIWDSLHLMDNQAASPAEYENVVKTKLKDWMSAVDGLAAKTKWASRLKRKAITGAYPERSYDGLTKYISVTQSILEEVGRKYEVDGFEE
jgi:hypothetical protein